MSKSSIVNTVKVVSALATPVTVSFSHCPMVFDLQPEGSFEVTEKTPPEGYIEAVFDSYEGRPILWVHGWESGETEISINGVSQDVPLCTRNNQPDFRLKGWPDGRPEAPAVTGLFVSDERTEGDNRIDVEDSGTVTSHANPPKQPIWYSGASINGGPPTLILHDDGLRIIGAHSQVVTEAGAADDRK
ncbi:hypothetical protein AB0N89_12315 [Amycolatopsis sp. NPDC089917]|uniref:hypothetical protein n=1 Tax=Amycolatopsis sp. NPDC089917 TaxID=3155187 RepID=UPI003427857B